MRADLQARDGSRRCPGTVVLTGAVRTRSDHDLATATARSVAGVTAVDDCIDDEC